MQGRGEGYEEVQKFSVKMLNCLGFRHEPNQCWANILQVDVCLYTEWIPKLFGLF